MYNVLSIERVLRVAAERRISVEKVMREFDPCIACATHGFQRSAGETSNWASGRIGFADLVKNNREGRQDMAKRVSIGLGLAFLAVLLGVLVVACGSAQEKAIVPTGKDQNGPSDLDGKSLVEERCTKCHNLERVEAAKKTQEEWKTTVERMVSNGAELNQAEQTAVIEHLSKTYPK